MVRASRSIVYSAKAYVARCIPVKRLTNDTPENFASITHALAQTNVCVDVDFRADERQNGVGRSACNIQCRHEVITNVDHLPGDLTVLSFGPRKPHFRHVVGRTLPAWNLLIGRLWIGGSSHVDGSIFCDHGFTWRLGTSGGL
jgi:hypothetical protein